MGKITQEKKKSILKTYERVKEFKRTGEIEEVDWRVVKRCVEEKRKAEEADYGLVKPLRTTTQKSDVPATFLPLSDAAPGNRQKDKIKIVENEKSREEQEAAIIRLYDKGMTPIEVVTTQNVPANLAKSVFLKYLSLVDLDYVARVFKKSEETEFHRLASLAKAKNVQELTIEQTEEVLRTENALLSVQGDLELTKSDLEHSQIDLGEVTNDLKNKNEELIKLNHRLLACREEIQKAIKQKSSIGKEIDSIKGELNKLRDQDYKTQLRQTCNEITRDRGYLLATALNSVVDAIREDQRNALLIADYDYAISKCGLDEKQFKTDLILAAGTAFDYFERAILRDCREIVDSNQSGPG